MLLLRVIQLASDICGDKILSSDWGGWHRPAWPRPGVVDFSKTLLKRQAIFPNFYLTLRFHKECVLTVWPTCHHNNYRFVPIAAANKWCRVCVMHLSMIDLYLCKCLGSSLLLSRRKKKRKNGQHRKSVPLATMLQNKLHVVVARFAIALPPTYTSQNNNLFIF